MGLDTLVQFLVQHLEGQLEGITCVEDDGG